MVSTLWGGDCRGLASLQSSVVRVRTPPDKNSAKHGQTAANLLPFPRHPFVLPGKNPPLSTLPFTASSQIHKVSAHADHLPYGLPGMSFYRDSPNIKLSSRAPKPGSKATCKKCVPYSFPGAQTSALPSMLPLLYPQPIGYNPRGQTVSPRASCRTSQWLTCPIPTKIGGESNPGTTWKLRAEHVSLASDPEGWLSPDQRVVCHT